MQITSGQHPEKLTILVADDEESLRDIAGRVLQHAGYEVIVVSGGAEAIEALAARGSEIRLVITDVVMPEVGAEGILAYLKEHGRSETPVICTSGYAASHVSSELTDGPNVQLLRKPYSLQELLRLVETALSETERRG